MSSVESDWFRDPDAIVTALNSDASASGGLPDIPGYEAIAEICRGNQAVVLLGRQKATGERVAIKVLYSAAWISERARQRFEREIELVSSLHHPNIVRVLESGSSTDGHPFLVMEYVEGVPLDEYLTSLHNDDAPSARDRSLQRVLRLFITICDAVSHAHRRGIMHRDLKPTNIRVDAHGQPRVLDFGLARLAPKTAAEGPERLSLTATTQFLGTPAYAAPEQFLLKPHEIDTRADVYALGVILHQAVTSRLPYRDISNIGGLIRSITGNEIQLAPLSGRGVSALTAKLPPDLEAVIRKALAGEPRERYQTVNALADDVRAVLEGRPTTARTPTRREAFFRAIRQNPAVAALIIAIVAVSLGFAATATTMALRLEQARSQAVLAEERALADAARSRAVLDFLTGLIFQTHTAEDDAQMAMSRIVLDRAHDRMAANPPGDSTVRAELHNIVGRSYYSIAASERAIEHLRAAVADEGFMDQPSRRLHIQALLSLILIDEELFDDAQEVVQQFLDERAASTTSNPQWSQSGHEEKSSINVFAATTLFTLARRLRHDAGNLHLARMVLREALDSSPLDTEPHRVHGSMLIHLAEISTAQSEPIDRVMPLLTRAVEIATQHDGADSRFALETRSAMACAMEQQGRLAEALAEMSDIARRAAASLGDSSPQTLATLVALARLQLNTGDHAAAHHTLTAALPLCLATLGPDHSMTIEVERLLAEETKEE